MRYLKNFLILGIITLLCSCTNYNRKNYAEINSMTNHELWAMAQSCFKHGDNDCAVQYLRPLSANGNAKATYALGYIYYYAQGTKQNKEVGRSLIREAAAQGDKQAVEALKRITENTVSAVQ